jgi:UDP-N-acetylglucosamine 2-epimerase (non-hydrolysing)
MTHHRQRSPSALRLLAIAGTRPEAIKLAPVLRTAAAHPDVTAALVSTGQHSELAAEILRPFDVVIDVDLGIGRTGQTPNDIAARTLMALPPVLSDLGPDVVIVQGDTTSAMAGALAAFNLGIPVVHLEAGLRTGSLSAPFPEEANRRLISAITSLHLAPTPRAAANLGSEGIDDSDIVVTGNTVIDALAWVIETGSSSDRDSLAAELDRTSGRVVLATIHRRESWGAPLERSARALRRICEEHPDIVVVLPLHPNPTVRDPLRATLGDVPNARLTDPLPYPALCQVLRRASLVISDSGGIQEEAPALGVPVIVLRDTTERPESVEAGVAQLVGTDEDAIVKAAAALLSERSPTVAAPGQLALAPNPFGDGHAARRSIDALLWRFAGTGGPPDPFVPGS